jgi:hypothetical protein
VAAHRFVVTIAALRYPACRTPELGGTMTQSLTPLESLFFNIILASLAVGLPIFLVLSIRFFWERNLSLGRSKELEKLIWQLHRIASAMEHQMNLSFPAVQPGTEEALDLAYLQPISAQPTSAVPRVAAAAAVASTAATPASQPVSPGPAAAQASTHQPAPPPPDEPASLPPLERRDPSVEAPRAGVNSMFGL